MLAPALTACRFISHARTATRFASLPASDHLPSLNNLFSKENKLLTSRIVIHTIVRKLGTEYCPAIPAGHHRMSEDPVKAGLSRIHQCTE